MPNILITPDDYPNLILVGRSTSIPYSISIILFFSLSSPIAAADIEQDEGGQSWCQIDDGRSNDPPWKDGMYNVMDMAFVNDSSTLIISEWPNQILDTPIISTWRISGGKMSEIGNKSLPFPGGVEYTQNTQCGVNIAIFDEFGWPMIVVARCLSKNIQVVELYNLSNDFVIQPDSRTELLNFTNPGYSFMHHLGRVGFDNEGSLWIFNGYNNQKDPDLAAQSPETLHGAILRGVISENFSLSAHPQNPGMIENSSWNPMVHSIGLRMPWRAAIDDDGNWWVGDVGGALFENVFRVNRTGMNFGFSTDSVQRCINCTGVEGAWITYSHDYNDSYNLDDPEVFYSFFAAVYVGVFVPDSGEYPENLSGKVIFGDFTRGWMRAMDTSKRNESSQFSHLTGVVDMEINDGGIYALRTGVQVSESVRDPGLWIYSETGCLEFAEELVEVVPGEQENLDEESSLGNISLCLISFLVLSVVMIFFMLILDE